MLTSKTRWRNSVQYKDSLFTLNVGQTLAMEILWKVETRSLGMCVIDTPDLGSCSQIPHPQILPSEVPRYIQSMGLYFWQASIAIRTQNI